MTGLRGGRPGNAVQSEDAAVDGCARRPRVLEAGSEGQGAMAPLAAAPLMSSSTKNRQSCQPCAGGGGGGET